MATERELCHDLFEECIQLVSYASVDKDHSARVWGSINRIRAIVAERLAIEESGELDDRT